MSNDGDPFKHQHDPHRKGMDPMELVQEYERQIVDRGFVVPNPEIDKAMEAMLKHVQGIMNPKAKEQEKAPPVMETKERPQEKDPQQKMLQQGREFTERAVTTGDTTPRMAKDSPERRTAIQAHLIKMGVPEHLRDIRDLFEAGQGKHPGEKGDRDGQGRGRGGPEAPGQERDRGPERDRD